MKTHSTAVQFTSQFFQSTGHVSLQETGNTTLSISYTPEKYGTLEAFLQHADFPRATAQYQQLFAGLNNFIARYCRHPEAIQTSFNDFWANIQYGLFNARQVLLYGEGKNAFDHFYHLLHDENIALEQRVTAIINLAQELHACIDGSINSLIVIIRQLQWARAGNLGKALSIKEQAIEQCIYAFNAQRSNNLLMEKHSIAVYHNFLRNLYGLPSLLHDMYASNKILNISHQDLYGCLQYVESVINPYYIINVMAEEYFAELHSVLSCEGIGLNYQQATEHLFALKTKLTPIYGDIPDSCLLLEHNGRYYATASKTLIKVALLQALQSCGVLCVKDTLLFYQYTLPDRRENIRYFEPGRRQFRIREQILHGETICIYHANTLYWIQAPGRIRQCY
jgi:hypothetical protein